MKKFVLAAAVVLSVATVTQAQQDKVEATTTTATAVNTDGAAMKFDKNEYNFGTVKQGDKVEYSFDFVNSGKEALIISEAHGSCGCTVPEWPKQPLKKGEKGVIKVTFNSAGKSGMQDKTVTITSNAPDSPKVLHIKGTVEVPAATPQTAPVETPKN